MKMGNPSDLSVSLLSSSDNVSSDATYIVSPSSDLPITDSDLWLDSMSDSSKKHSMFNFYAVSVFCMIFWMFKPERMPFSFETGRRKTSTSCPLTSVRPNTEDAELRTPVGSGKKTKVSVNKCSVCRKEFKTACALKTHLLIHRHDGPHICSICQRVFKHSHQL